MPRVHYNVNDRKIILIRSNRGWRGVSRGNGDFLPSETRLSSPLSRIMGDNVKRERRNEKIKIGFKRKISLKNDNWDYSVTRILLHCTNPSVYLKFENDE